MAYIKWEQGSYRYPAAPLNHRIPHFFPLVSHTSRWRDWLPSGLVAVHRFQDQGYSAPLRGCRFFFWILPLLRPSSVHQGWGLGCLGIRPIIMLIGESLGCGATASPVLAAFLESGSNDADLLARTPAVTRAFAAISPHCPLICLLGQQSEVTRIATRGNTQ